MSFRSVRRRFSGSVKGAAVFAQASALSLGFIASLSTPTAAADFIAVSPAIASDPVCHDQRVINRAVAQFAYMVRHVPEMPVVSINAVGNVNATRFEPKTYPSGIARHYCRATALLSNGEQREMWYMVEQSQGFASIGSNVESCVAGFDKWYVYDGRCRVLR